MKDIDRIFVPIEKIINFLRNSSIIKKNRKGVQLDLMKINLYERIIDWEKSKVIPLVGQVLCINDRLFDKVDKERFSSQIIREILEVKDPEGEPLAYQIIDARRIYSEAKSPDIIILPRNIDIHNTPFMRTLWSKPSKDKWTGMHDLYGVLLVYGPEVKSGSEIQRAKIFDIAPTILHILGIPISKDMDGRVLREIFREDGELFRRQIVYQEAREDEKIKIKQRIEEMKRTGKI